MSETSRRPGPPGRTLAVAAVLTVSLTAALSSVASAAPAPVRSTARPSPILAGTVTLITGDKVTVQQRPGAQPRVSLVPAPGRRNIPVTVATGGGRIEVLPADAAALVADKRLDRRLFDAGYLLREGYGDAARKDLPLLVSYQDGARSGAVRQQTGLTVRRSVAGFDAATVSKREAASRWPLLVRGSGRQRALAAGVQRIRLDGRVRSALKESVPQIGAPAAWKAGLTGKGVTVAVLDTGYDKDHPDLAGVADSKDFTDSGSVQDEDGHGTHVAATVAGRNATHRGVAPDARLVIGKVLTVGGGTDSQVLAGMEWAATQAKARIVSMSLGAGDSPETDPLEEAVERLTRQTGALFVIAAGNAGPGAVSVGSPGSAPAALTVGAVDKKDRLAEFSSRGGGRYATYTLKPDLTAPGVDITAAKPGGGHQAMSGTSMATPHVAGAAALLAQAHPDWKAEQLKAALVSSTKPVAAGSPFEQGSGRLDAGRALAGTVTATPSVDFGLVRWPYEQTKPVRRQVSYRNTGTKPITLKLGLTVTGPSVKPAPGGLFTLDRTELTAAPGATATAALTLNPGRGSTGSYGGHLVATAGDEQLRTNLGSYLEPESHQLTVRILDRDGRQPTDERATSATVYDYRHDSFFWAVNGDSFRLPKGRYAVFGSVNTPGPTGPKHSVASLGVSEYPLEKAATVTLDARRATRVRTTVDHPTAQAGDRQLSLSVTTDQGPGFGMTKAVHHDTQDLYLGSTGAANRLRFAEHHVFTEPTVRLRVEQPTPFTVPVQGDLSGFWPNLLGTHRLELVNAGSGTDQELDRAQVKGRIAVLRIPKDQHGAAGQRLAALRKAEAAAAVLLVEPDEWPSLGEEPALPLAVVSRPDGHRLLDLTAQGPAVAVWQGVGASPYQYTLGFGGRGAVPDRLEHPVRTTELARLRVDYRALGQADRAGLFTSYEQDGEQQPGLGLVVPVVLPSTRTEYLLPGRAYRRQLSLAGLVWEFPESRSFPRGEHAESFLTGVLGPSLAARPYDPDLGAGRPAWAYRQGDTLTVRVPLTVGTDPGHASASGGTGDLVLYRDGKRLGASGSAGAGQFTVPAGEAGYRLVASTDPGQEGWKISTDVRSVWTFRSAHTVKATALPLLAVRYRPELDQLNRAPAGKKTTFPVWVEREAGAARAGVDQLAVQYSADGGRTWQPVTLTKAGNRWTASLTNPATGSVSLRATAKDSQGNAVEQTITDAYLVR